MKNRSYTSLQLRELFHLEFLRWFSRKIKPEYYAVKGGTNIRFFFKSFRYSEDMDLDVRTVPVVKLKDTVMDILTTRPFTNNLKTFGIEGIVPPDMLKAKQTDTTQRFKVHLITTAQVDLFTKIEFSRRGFKGRIVIQPVADTVLREYRLTPLLVSHYDILSTVAQKVDALAGRAVTQARDIFDLFVLSSQVDPAESGELSPDAAKIKKAHQNIFTIGFEQFRDTVVSYLAEEDQHVYATPAAWDEIRLKTANFLEELKK